VIIDLQVGPSLSKSLLSVAAFEEGKQPSRREEYILPCRMLSGLGTPFRRGEAGGAPMPLTGFVMRLRMGKVQDYFKPNHAASLCEMLTSNNRHDWAPKYLGEKFDSGLGEPVNVDEEPAETTEAGETEPTEAPVPERGKWITPEYVNDTRLVNVLGGSARGWPARKSAYPEDARE